MKTEMTLLAAVVAEGATARGSASVSGSTRSCPSLEVDGTGWTMDGCGSSGGGDKELVRGVLDSIASPVVGAGSRGSGGGWDGVAMETGVGVGVTDCLEATLRWSGTPEHPPRSAQHHRHMALVHRSVARPRPRLHLPVRAMFAHSGLSASFVRDTVLKSGVDQRSRPLLSRRLNIPAVHAM